MKKVFDIVQVGLSMPDALAYVFSALLVLLGWQVLKSASELCSAAWRVLGWLRCRLVRLSKWSALGVCALALPVYFARAVISDKIQYFEQVFSPAYVTGDTSAHATAIYEAELARRCDSYEAEVVKRRTRETAAKLGCSPLAIYEVAYSECGLNPFRVRDDGVAAGWIQFTRAGAAGITTLPEVKSACKRRDVAQMMDWTEAYLTRAAAGRALGDATGVYVAVFAPGHIGGGDERVLYEGWGNAAYSENKIFDGYFVDSKGRIMRSRAAMDGRITIGELRLHLEAKKARLISENRKRF